MTEVEILRKILIELRVISRSLYSGNLDYLYKWRYFESEELKDETIEEMVGE